MLAKLGQMEAAEATDALTSAMKGYQLTVAETEGIVDSFAAVDMSAAVSAGYLATAMSRTAVGAKSMGIDFDTLTGAIATVGEVTQESAEVIGNFFKTMIARMGNVKAGNLIDPETAESLSDVESVLKGVGIELRESDGEFRNFWEVLEDVNEEWDNWGTVQQKAVSVAFSGTRQQERFLVLMENFDRVSDLAKTSADSAGTAVKKYDAYLNSITASVERFKTAVYDLSDSLINSGLIKGVINLGTAFVSGATAVIDFAGAVPTLAAAFGLLKLTSLIKNIWAISSATMALGGTVMKSNGAVLALMAKMPLLSATMAGEAAAAYDAAGGTSTFAVSLQLLKTRLLGVLKTFGPWILGITAVSAGVIALVRNYKTADEVFDEINTRVSETEGAIKSLNEEQEKAAEIIEELIELAQKRRLTPEEEGQLEYEQRRLKLLETELKYQEYLLEIEKERAREQANSILRTAAGLDTDLILTDKVGLAADAESHSSQSILSSYIDKLEELRVEKKALEDDFIKTSSEETRARIKEVDADILAISEKAQAVISYFQQYTGVASKEVAGPVQELLLALMDLATTGVADALGYSIDEGAEGVDNLTNSFTGLHSIVTENADSLKTLKNAIDTALDWRSTAEQTNAALEGIKELTGIDIDADADNMIETLQLMKSYIDGDAEAFENFAETAVKSLGIKPKADGIESVVRSLIENFGKLEGVAKTTAIAILSMFESIGAVTTVKYDDRIKAARAMGYGQDDVWDGNTRYGINDDWFSDFDTKKSVSSSSGSKTDTYLEHYKSLIDDLDHLRAMDLISEAEYYRRLESLSNQYLKGKSKYLDEYRSVQEKLWAYQKELYERQRDAEIEAAEQRAEANREALENQYDAEREALEKRKDLLEEEKDAYKELIDYKKDLLDDESDERAHDQRVAELNQEISQMEAELAALALDNSAKANARRIELHDELLSKQQELEDEQWDWSVDNQKDALDREYERYEETIDAEIKLLEEQLDALEKSYDAQLDHIDSMLEANIAAINSSFDALINRAQDAANQIAAIFANINISSSSGIAELQSGLVSSGYDIGNYGSNRDGVDGVMGKMTTKGLQSYLNDLQNSGAIYFGDSLKVDGKVGSKTRKAIDAAIAAGYLNASFDELHTGGVVGNRTDRSDLDIIKKLIPLNDNEVLAKLLKNEMVLTEGQQEFIREAFRSVAASRDNDISVSRAMAGSAVQNNSPSFTITNVFEGDVDSEALRRLDEWGNRFKKDVQNGVFKIMNQQNRLAGKTPVKSI